MPSIWSETTQIAPRPPLPGDLETDTAVIGGGVGNLIDRVRLGYVVDMLDCTFIEFPVFNVADCFVVCGTIAALVYYIWIYPNTDAKNWEKDHGTDPAQGK